MPKTDEDRPVYWGLACLLAFSPVVYGGNKPWASLFMVTGIGLLGLIVGFRQLWKGSLSFFRAPEDFFLLLGLAWAAIGLYRPHAVPDGIDSFLVILGCVGCFFLAKTLSSSGWAMDLIRILCWAGNVFVVIGLLQMADLVPHGWWRPPRFMASTFVNHNHFAAYLELLLPFSFLFWIAPPAGEGNFSRFLSVLSSLLIAAGIILSCSRGAWLSLALTGSVVLGGLAFREKNLGWNWRKGVILAFFFALAAGFVASQSAVSARIASFLEISEDSSVQIRQKIWQGTWELVKKNPVLGQGLGTFIYSFPRYRPAGLYMLTNHAHNEYLELVAELGLVGLGIVIGLSLLLAGRMIRLIRSGEEGWKKGLGLAGLVGLGSVALHSLIDFPWRIPAVAFHGSVLAGLVTAVPYRSGSASWPKAPWTVSFFSLKFSRAIAFLLLAGFIVLTGLFFVPSMAANLWAWRGDLEFENKKLEKAIPFYEKATHTAPYRVRYHEQLGKSFVRLAQKTVGRERELYLSRAAEAYRKALALVPHDAMSAYRLGEVLQKKGEFEQADHWLSQAVRQDPHNPLYWKDAGELKLILGKPSEAAVSFRRASELARPYGFFPWIFGDLNQADYFIQRGETALSEGRAEYAQTAFAVARELDSNLRAAQVGLAVSALNAGDREKAEQWMSGIEDPASKARWFAALAQRDLAGGRPEKAQANLEESLKWDASNLLARQLQLILAKKHQEDSHKKEALRRLLALNQSPVFVTGKANRPVLVWEPKQGHYAKGKSLQGSWGLFSRGSIHQALALPPGRIRFQVVAKGSKARGVGPMMKLYWNGRPILTTEVLDEGWFTYDAKTEINAGESILTVAFTNDLKDKVTREDRNLKLARVVASWEPF